MDDSVRSSESDSPASGAVADHQLTEKNEPSNLHNLDNYSDVGLVRENSPSYTPELRQQQEASELPSFSVSPAFVILPVNSLSWSMLGFFLIVVLV